MSSDAAWLASDLGAPPFFDASDLSGFGRAIPGAWGLHEASTAPKRKLLWGDLERKLKTVGDAVDALM
eukprot:8955139-Alexandrium_andersonii.AAC.1